jgi:hypothetical protein
MNPKKLSFDEEGREKLLNGITQIAKAVKNRITKPHTRHHDY